MSHNQSQSDCPPVRLERLREIVARRANDEWGRSHVKHLLDQVPGASNVTCPRYAGIVEESGDESVIVADSAAELALEMASLADCEIPIVPVELVDLDTTETQLAVRNTSVRFVGTAIAAQVGVDDEAMEWNFYLPDEDRNAVWTNHCYILQFVCNGFGADPAAAWKEALAEGRVPEDYDVAEPPSVAIQTVHEGQVNAQEAG